MGLGRLFKRKKKKSGGIARLLFTIVLLVFLAWIFFGSKLPFARSEPLENLRQQIINSPPTVEIAKRINPEHQKIVENLSRIDADTTSEEAFTDLESQLQTLAGKGQLFTQEASKVLNEVVKPTTDDDTNVADRAIKYGQYLYCKQVVGEWEKNNGN